MTTDRDTQSMHPILDEMALDAITQPIDSIKKELSDAGINVQSEITRMSDIAHSLVSQHQGLQLSELPDAVPDDDESVSQLLEHLFTLPQIASTNLTMSFRNLDEITMNDKRELTISLLELIKNDQ